MMFVGGGGNITHHS